MNPKVGRPSSNYLTKTEVTILVSNNLYSGSRKVSKDWEDNFFMIKGRVHHKKFTLLNIYTPNEEPRKHFKQLLIVLKGPL